MYDKIESFDKLCKIWCEFILSNVKCHPFLIIDQSKPNLYELELKNAGYNLITIWENDYFWKKILNCLYIIIK